MDEYKSRVYVQTDDKGRILRCEGGYTMSNIIVNVETGEVDSFGRPITEPVIPDDWIYIAEGSGDRYNLCQSHYFDDGLYTEDGIPKWKLSNGTPYRRMLSEIEADREAQTPAEPTPTLENRVENLELDSAETKEALELILSGVTE